MVPALAVSLALPAAAFADPAPPTKVFVYNGGENNEGRDNAFDSGAVGYILSSMGMLTPRGKPPTPVGNDLKQGTQVVGHVTRDGAGRVTGFTNADGSQRAYNLDTSARFSDAWSDVAANGAVEIDKHGAKGGGGQDFDKGGMHSGVEGDDAPGSGGTGVPTEGGTYVIEGRPLDAIDVYVNSCHSEEDPDGDGPQRSVCGSFRTVHGVGTVTGHVGRVYKGAVLRFDTGTPQERAHAKRILEAKAAEAGFRNEGGSPDVGSWVSALPFSQQYALIEALLAGTGVEFSLSYGKEEEPCTGMGPGCDFLPPASVGPAGDTLTYRAGPDFPAITLEIPRVRWRRRRACSFTRPSPIR